MTGRAFHETYIDLRESWTSPFVRWQGELQSVNSLDLAAIVTARALEHRAIDPADFDEVILGWTVPQRQGFYGAPTLAARIGAPTTSGPMISQACATSVACLVAAGANNESRAALVVTTDRTSNGPLLIYPQPSATGGAPEQETWVLDNFARDPWGGSSMAEAADAVAHEEAISREEIDDVTILRHEQYALALDDDRAFHRRYMVEAAFTDRRGDHRVSADAGIYALDPGRTRALVASVDGGVVTRDTQTHPADGCAGVVVRHGVPSRGPTIRILAAGFSRVQRARMPRAVVPAALCALSAAALNIQDMNQVNTHNPFAVSDAYFSRETGFSSEAMNCFGSPLVYGHPQAPTGMRAVIELAHSLAQRGGGLGLFTGCAAGDTAGALVIEVTGS
ncbi:MAG: thiolase family protein [Candidatus Nanopelagicales bacterium]|nr:thiolase family protein [Candidatus Nanopelagicales bacterium]